MSRVRGSMLAAASCALIALAGCGSSSDDDSSSTSATSAASGATTSTTSSGSAINAEAVRVGLQFTDGRAGRADPSAEPVTIGFVNQSGGTPSWPELIHAGDASVRFVNDELGGIDGHPIKLDKCIIQAEEDGQKCAAQFLANRDIDIAVMTNAVFGNDTFYRTINGKFPTIVSVAGVAADYDSPHVYELDGGGDGVLETMAQDSKKIGARKIAIISSNNPAGKFITGDVLIPKLRRMGIDTKAVYISDTATTPEYVSALQAAGAADADAAMLVPVAASGCISMYEAMRQLAIDKPVVTDFWCYNDPVPESTNGGPEDWYITSLADNQLLDSTEATAFKDVMNAYGEGRWINIGSTPKTFGDIMTIAKWGNAIGFDRLSGEAFEQQILAFRGPAFMVPGNIACGKHPTYKGICGDSAAGSIYRDGRWQTLGDTRTVTLNP